MNLKSTVLLVVSVIFILTLLNLPVYSRWLQNKIFSVCNIDEQLEKMDIEQRRELRYGYNYMVFKDVAIKLKEDHNATVLLPPAGYLKSQKIDVTMVEPSTFYYYTGQKAVLTTSPQVRTASWALLAESPGHLALIRLKSVDKLDSLVKYLSQFPQR